METKKHIFKTHGTCSTSISFDKAPDGTITNVCFTGGCNGNLKAVAKLVEGMDIHEVIKRLKGIDCNGRGTSCPDQLAKALEQYLEQNK